MITKIVIRSNGDAVLHHEDGLITVSKMLDELIIRLVNEKLLDGNADIYTPLNSQPTKVKQWFELKPLE